MEWKCKRCGYCCTLRPRISFLEHLKLLALGYRGFSEKNIHNQRFIKVRNNKCIFLKGKDNKPFCTIYKHRPKVCREYPGLKEGECKT